MKHTSLVASLRPLARNSNVTEAPT